MFRGCSSLKSIDLSSFNTTNVNDMSGMFSCCSSLKSIDLSLFNTNNVTNMSRMFNGCSSLKNENVKMNKNEKKNLLYTFDIIGATPQLLIFNNTHKSTFSFIISFFVILFSIVIQYFH